jgi:hypothetical protein
MLLFLAGISIYLFNSSKAVQKQQKKADEKQLDKKLYGMEQEDISDDDIIPLYIKGSEKNVETFSYASVKKIYNTKNSAKTAKALEKLKKKNSYNADNPLWAYNPYGTNELSLYLYFETVEAYTVEYTIHTEDSDTADFNRSLTGDTSTKVHEYQIIGLTPGRENYIILKLYDTKGEEKIRRVYSITPEKVTGVNEKLIVNDGSSLEQVTQGLYFFLGHDWENKSAPRGIWMYDNSGVLRGAIPTVSGRSTQLLELSDGLLYNYSSTGLAKVDKLGQVIATYKLKSYSISGEFIYDGYQHIVFLATKKGASTKGDYLLTLDLESGKFGDGISIGSLLKGISKKKSNWLNADSLVMAGSNGVLICSKGLSSLIRLQNIFSANPTVAYVIGSESTWEKTDITRLSYKDEEASAEPYKPSGLTSIKNSAASDGTLLVSFYQNNKTTKTSNMYEYTIDESAGTYYLEASFELPTSTKENSVQSYNGHWIVNSAEDCGVTEYDANGKAISTLKYTISNYTPKVYKMDMKGFWFQ